MIKSGPGLKNVRERFSQVPHVKIEHNLHCVLFLLVNPEQIVLTIQNYSRPAFENIQKEAVALLCKSMPAIPDSNRSMQGKFNDIDFHFLFRH